ncbi:hypothetical protein T190_00535 [Sinorhizobium meliloti CCBAU 01290]|nr:hypothetical protein T190_00535 [Sinorhizobium meliloti CCBAU 01290]
MIDLFEQTIEVDGGETAFLKTLPTADAVAELPQKLADAMDPLARIRSVLSRATSAWLTPSDSSAAQAALIAARRAALIADFEPVNGGPAPLRLKRALDLTAIQVLGQRFDLVGRFEVPLIDALKADGGKAAQALLALHLKALPWLLEVEDVSALRIPESAITTLSIDGKPLTLDDASPFSVTVLRAALGLAKLDGDAQPVAESEILRNCGLLLALRLRQSPTAGRDCGILSLGSKIPPRASYGFALNGEHLPQLRKMAIKAGRPAFQSGLVRACARKRIAFLCRSVYRGHRCRANRLVPGCGASERGHTTLRAITDRYAGIAMERTGYTWALSVVLALMPPLSAGDILPSLLEMILSMAATEAAGIAARGAFRADPFDRITPLPLPMSLQVDQLRTFPRETDAWTRLAGYGLVAARTGYTAENGDFKTTNASPYVSLNPATLYIGGISENPGPNGNAAIARGIVVEGAAADDSTRAFVDPWPYSPGDGIGISDAVAEFANSWATAPMPGHAVVDQPGPLQGVAAARVVAGPPPRASNVGGSPLRSQMAVCRHFPLVAGMRSRAT